MADYTTVIFYSLIGGLVSFGACLLLLSNKSASKKLAIYGTPFAGGALLATVFLDLLKDGLEQSTPDIVLFGALLGIVIFFLAEGFLHWFHHHHSNHEKQDVRVPLIVTGNMIHNAMDGVAIAAAFLVNIPTGIITTLVVAIHEIPHEIGDAGLLLGKGVSRAGALLFNLLSAVATILVAIIVFAIGSKNSIPTGLLLGISAGFLLYIALSDVIPTIHAHSKDKHRPFDLQALLLIVGVIIVGIAIQLAHRFIS